jgi:hypothetical protein
MKRAMLGLGIREPVNVRFWPKADISGRIPGPKIGYPAVFAPLSVR